VFFSVGNVVLGGLLIEVIYVMWVFGRISSVFVGGLLIFVVIMLM